MALSPLKGIYSMCESPSGVNKKVVKSVSVFDCLWLWGDNSGALSLKAAPKVIFFFGGGCAALWFTCTHMPGCCGVLLLTGAGRDMSSAQMRYSNDTQRCLIISIHLNYASSVWIEKCYITKYYLHPKTQIQIGLSEVTQHVLLWQVSKIMNEIMCLLY